MACLLLLICVAPLTIVTIQKEKTDYIRHGYNKFHYQSYVLKFGNFILNNILETLPIEK